MSSSTWQSSVCHFPFPAVGLVGDDENGRWILQQCARHGIDTAALQQTTQAPTSYTDVMTVQSTGRRTFFMRAVPMRCWMRRTSNFSKTNARIFHLGYLLLLDRLDAAERKTRDCSRGSPWRVRKRPAYRPPSTLSAKRAIAFARIVLPALPHVDLCIMNEFEAGRVTGRTIRSGEELDRGALRGGDARARGCRCA
jgi:sugar/nucleoside kinase (ribokinase family)